MGNNNIENEELIEALIEEFDCGRSIARQVAEKRSQYVSDLEESKLKEDLEDPNYIVRMLREKPADYPDGDEGVRLRWDWWIGSLNPLQDVSQYQVD
ncbi:MAG: hypothetical protein ABEI86_11435 [Halobacteriaceae archaeon]